MGWQWSCQVPLPCAQVPLQGGGVDVAPEQHPGTPLFICICQWVLIPWIHWFEESNGAAGGEVGRQVGEGTQEEKMSSKQKKAAEWAKMVERCAQDPA